MAEKHEEVKKEEEKKFKNLVEKLNYIQTNLKAPKNQYNEFGGYRYRSLEDITDALKPLLVETGTILLMSDDIKQIGTRFYIESTVTLSDGAESISVKAYAREAEEKKKMDDSQLTGAASSYARKYALNGLFAIDDTKDADSLNKGNEEEEKKQKPKNQPNQKQIDQQKDNLKKQIMKLIVGYQKLVNIQDRSKAIVDMAQKMHIDTGTISTVFNNGSVDDLITLHNRIDQLIQEVWKEHERKVD
jgi:hypothetical protein